MVKHVPLFILFTIPRSGSTLLKQPCIHLEAASFGSINNEHSSPWHRGPIPFYQQSQLQAVTRLVNTTIQAHILPTKLSVCALLCI